MRRSAWSEDVKRVQDIAINAAVDAFASSPLEVIEMLSIVARHDEADREQLIRFAAEAVYPFSDAGDRAIDRFIERAKKGGPS